MSEWVKCSCKMPDDLTDVLVLLEDESMAVAHTTSGFWHASNVEASGYGGVDLDAYPMAWMPLPPPPSE